MAGLEQVIDGGIHDTNMRNFIDSSPSLFLNLWMAASKCIMMSASAIYGTYAFAGNDGRLAPAGVEKMLEAYRQQLEQVQLAKAETQGKA